MINDVEKLVLHVGLNKTGSSALQSWLSNNITPLKNNSISYTLLDRESVEYRVSSGNGSYFNRFLDGEVSEKSIIETYFSLTKKCKTVLISKENFNLTTEKTAVLNSFCNKHSIKLQVIIFIRDIYAWCYSIYVQLIKRHSYTQSFEFFVENLKSIPHVAYTNTIMASCSQVNVLNYSIVKSDINTAFLKVLGIKSTSFTSPPISKVNRTLDFDEIEFVKFLSNIESICDFKPEIPICRIVSDFLVNSFPEKKSGVLLSWRVNKILKVRFEKPVMEFNDRVGCNIKLLYTNDEDRGQIIANSKKFSTEFIDILLKKQIYEKIPGKLLNLIMSEFYFIDKDRTLDAIAFLISKNIKNFPSELAFVFKDASIYWKEKSDLITEKKLISVAFQSKPKNIYILERYNALRDIPPAPSR